jgi:exodeoxyribonuclease V
MVSLSDDQKKALEDLLYWYRHDKAQMQYVTLGGYAGTGKTTLIAQLRNHLEREKPSLSVGFASYTGKASQVLQAKLKSENALRKQDSVGTIHSLIYSPIMNDKSEIVGWKTKDKVSKDLIIVDEASMIDRQIWENLLSYRIPIILVGDHGQLPPIGDTFNLMAKPNLLLTEIHRQAKNNPIIAVSIQARTLGEIKVGRYGQAVVKYSRNEPETNEAMEEQLTRYNADTLVLCGYNTTRRRLNNYIRTALGYDSPAPVSGDRVICLRNNHKAGIFNGQLGTVSRIESKSSQWYAADIVMDGDGMPYHGFISVDQFGSDTALQYTPRRNEIVKGDLFDFGYVTTVHKSQGSQARRVILFEERFAKMDDDQWRRWLYTAVTRAQEELYIF